MTQEGQLPDFLVTNIHRRFTGVSATVAALVPRQQTERDIAVVDTGALRLSNTWPVWRVISRGWSRPPSGGARVWHARRDVEMLLGLFLKYILRQKWKLIFTSAAPKRHGRVLRSIMNRMDAIISVSERAAFFLDWHSVVVPHGVDTDDFVPAADRDALVAESGLPATCLIGAFGRLRDSKGTDLFVQAMIDLLPDHPHCAAFLTGLAKDESYLANLKQGVREAGLTDRIVFLGDLPAADFRLWYQRASLVVAASRSEGFGLTPMEAMASGAPAVTSGAGYWPELIKPGINGQRFETGNVEDLKRVLRPLLADPTALKELGETAREDVVAHHSIEGEVAGIHAMYDAVLSGKTSRRKT